MTEFHTIEIDKTERTSLAGHIGRHVRVMLADGDVSGRMSELRIELDAEGEVAVRIEIDLGSAQVWVNAAGEDVQAVTVFVRLDDD